MTKAFRYVAIALFLLLIQLSPKPALACVEGLSWGMDLANVEKHLGTSLKPVQEGLNRIFLKLQIFR